MLFRRRQGGGFGSDVKNEIETYGMKLIKGLEFVKNIKNYFELNFHEVFYNFDKILNKYNKF